LSNLSQLYSRHIALEDSCLFPAAEAALAHAEQKEIGIEMAQRRGLDPQRLAEKLVGSSQSVE
jgi:hemerythrin-like domain-containing protein